MFIAVLFVLYGALFSFSQERIASENSQVDAGVEIRTLEDSGLPIEEWVQGCWKAVVTKEERYNEVKDYKLSADKIEEYLKYYGEKRTFYIKITEDYLQYQFPEDDNEFDTRHPYTIDEGFVDGIYVGDELLANIYNNTLHIEISDKFDRNGYHIELSRVADLGPNEESITGAEIETNVYAALLEESIITNLTDAKGENYDWLIGEWENINEDLGDWAKVVITPTTFKYVRNPNNQSVYEIETATEYPIAIQFEPGNSYRESGYLKLGEGGGSIICVDEECQQVYVIVGEYSDLYLNKDVIQEYGRCWKNVMWTYGEWKVSNIHQNQDYRIKITPFYYQKINANDPSASFATAKKEWYKPKWVEHKFMGYNACIGEFYLDFDQKLIYSTPGLNEKMCFEQTSKGTISKVIIWMILGLIALGVLWGIFILVKLFIRLIMLIIRKTIQAFKTTIEGFMQFSISCKKPIKNLVTNITDKPRKLTTTLWGIISEYYDEADSSYDYENEQESDYSWVYGTWVLEEGGEKHIISFGENGMCIDTYESPMFGNQSEVGSFSIRDGRIKVDNGDGYPSYITIEGRSLKSGSNYYRKR